MTPAKGQFDGECFRTMCDNIHATWYNPHTHGYYCFPCARRINEALAVDLLKQMQDHASSTGRAQ